MHFYLVHHDLIEKRSFYVKLMFLHFKRHFRPDIRFKFNAAFEFINSFQLASHRAKQLSFRYIAQKSLSAS